MSVRRVVIDDDGGAFTTPGPDISGLDEIAGYDQLDEHDLRELDEDARIDDRRERGLDDDDGSGPIATAWAAPGDGGEPRDTDLAPATRDPRHRESPQPRGLTEERKSTRALGALRSKRDHEEAIARHRADPPRIIAAKLANDDDVAAFLNGPASVLAVARTLDAAGIDPDTDVTEAFRGGRPTAALLGVERDDPGAVCTLSRVDAIGRRSSRCKRRGGSPIVSGDRSLAIHHTNRNRKDQST